MNDENVSDGPEQLPAKDYGNSNDHDPSTVEEGTEIGNEFTEDPYKERITIYDINIVTEMNTSQMTIQQEEGNQAHTHRYNLREQPTRWKERISLAIANKITGVHDRITGVHEETKEGQYLTIHPKVHAHVMLTQMNIKQGLLAFGERGNEAFLKELSQLHDKKALMPLQQSNMTHEERKKALQYLMFLKKSKMAL